MALMSKTKPVDEGCKKAYMFEGQRTVQVTLVIVALLCVPILLFGAPVYEFIDNKKKRKPALQKLNSCKKGANPDPQMVAALQANVDKYSHSFTELMIHQGVHTIEFVLSTISHTASYLRLWALSLAHAQLSDMLWHMILSKLALKDHSYGGAIRLYIIFAVWAAFTVSILVVMEGLSAFLHCLRLHWVEFMSKFFTGGGTPFRPFNFNAIIQSEERSPAEPGCKKMAAA